MMKLTIRKILLLLMAVAMMTCCVGALGMYQISGMARVTPRTATGQEILATEYRGDSYYENAVKFDVVCENLTANAQYTLLVLDEATVPTASNTVYINQLTADARGTVSFTGNNVAYPVTMQEGVYYIYVLGQDSAFEPVSSFVVTTATASELPMIPDEGQNKPLSEESTETAVNFSDVSRDAWYYSAVTKAVEQGITTGTSKTTFSPEAVTTRGQMVTFLWRAVGCPVVNYAMSFTDVDADAYYAEAVRWAVSEGITNGTSATTFSPNATVTRGQVVTFLYRYNGSKSVSAPNTFKDVKATDYYYNAVQWALEQNITNGTSAVTFSPGAFCTRGQVVTFLYRSMAK